MREENGVVFLDSPVIIREKTVNRVDIKNIESINLDADETLKGIKIGNSKLVSQSIRQAYQTFKIIFTLEYEQDVILKCNLADEFNNIVSADCVTIPKETFIEELIEAYSNKKSFKYKEIPSIKSNIETFKEKINEITESEKIFLIKQEINCKISIYEKNTLNKVGVANRMFFTDSTHINLCEAIIFNKNQIVNKLFDLEIELSENESLMITNIEITSERGENIKYFYATVNEAYFTRIESQNEVRNQQSILVLPPVSSSIEYLYTFLTKNNSFNKLTKYYRLNKKTNIDKIDVDKYMLG